MKALYICDNKEEWRPISNLFHSHFPKVELVCSMKGQEALEYLTFEGPFAVVMIEASIKSDDPTQLCGQIIDVTGERPIVFIGMPAMIRDRVSHDLYNGHEINGILERPLEVEEFTEIIGKSLDWAKEEEFEASIEELDREELLPMKIRNFYLFNSIPYDVFLELTSVKYVKVISGGKPYTEADINALSRRNIRYLYLKKDEYLKFLEDSVAQLQLKFAKKIKPASDALQFQIKAAMVIQQYLRTVGVTESIIELCSKVIDSIGETYDSAPKFKQILQLFPFESKDFAEQAVLTAYFCEAISDGLEWKSDIVRKKLGLASLLMDCTLTNEELAKVRTLNDPDLENFSDEEQLQFRSHPKKAAELVANFQGFPETDFIIFEHHELPDGSGFPQKLNASRLTAISSLFIMSGNIVSRLTLMGLSPSSLREALANMRMDFNVGHFRDCLTAIEKKLKT